MRIWQGIVAGIIVVVIALAAAIYSQVASIRLESVTDDLYVAYGLGGNVGILRTSEGTVIVDTMTLHLQGDRIRELAEEVTGQPVTAIINTHYHLDHTHGNPAFAHGTRVIATERTLLRLQQTDAEYFSGEAAALLPNETFTESRQVSIGNKTLQLIHPGRGHTDGDLVVLFVDEQVLHTGDLFFHNHYPNIDLEAGGSIQQWGATLDKVLTLPFERVIPGHGVVTDRAALRQFQQFINQLANIGRRAKAQGWSLADTKRSAELTEDAGYEEIRMIVPIGLNRAFVLQRTWEETHEAFTPLP